MTAPLETAAFKTSWVYRDDNGTVHTGSGRAIWADCPDCGTVPPLTKVQRLQLSDVRTVVFLGRYPDRTLCSNCLDSVPYRTVTLKAAKAVRVGPCDRRCLEGQEMCSCHCQGRCHGLGVCQHMEGER